MKKLRNLILILMLSLICIIQSGCYGEFRLTHNLHRWNGTVGDDLVNELVFLGLIIIPVYEFSMFLDVVFFNTIEFWSGSNPVAMKEGEKDSKLVSRGDKIYHVTATKNRFHVVELKGLDKGDWTDFVYIPENGLWYMESKSKSLIPVRP